MNKTIMKTILILTIALLPALTVAQMTNQEAIEQRQATFKEIKAAVAEIKDALKAKDFAAAAESSQVILSDARKIAELFPEGSYEGDTRAKKKIWKNLADFQERQQKLVIDAEQLQVASQSGDSAQLKDAFKALGKNCKGCHMRYRQIF
jgi:cytochrome c556